MVCRQGQRSAGRWLAKDEGKRAGTEPLAGAAPKGGAHRRKPWRAAAGRCKQAEGAHRGAHTWGPRHRLPAPPSSSLETTSGTRMITIVYGVYKPTYNWGSTILWKFSRNQPKALNAHRPSTDCPRSCDVACQHDSRFLFPFSSLNQTRTKNIFRGVDPSFWGDQ